MTREAPVTDLDSRFSSPGATAVPWMEAEQLLQKADVFWLSTVRPEGRSHVVPLIAVWLDGALYFITGEDERKAKNLAKNTQVVITTGCNSLSEGLDIVVEGEAVAMSDDATRLRVLDAYVAKYGEGWRFGIHDVLLFEVTPTTAFGFGRSEERPSWGPPPAGGFSQTRWSFPAGPAATRAR
jgi:nitroimidazol reductase NimA-like FMN-containing flavoprotein (pyridoxamine 5'-phosphate oxidase superfamily)